MRQLEKYDEITHEPSHSPSNENIPSTADCNLQIIHPGLFSQYLGAYVQSLGM